MQLGVTIYLSLGYRALCARKVYSCTIFAVQLARWVNASHAENRTTNCKALELKMRGNRTLINPSTNIRIGSYYLAKQLNHSDTQL